MTWIAGSMSANTGVAPQADIASAVAMKVSATVITSSPGPTPQLKAASRTASVPFASPTARAAPHHPANLRSNSATSGPMTNDALPSTSAIA